MNEANSPSWSEAIQDFFSDLKTAASETRNNDKSEQQHGNGDKEILGSCLPSGSGEMENQYVGALVADIHNILVSEG